MQDHRSITAGAAVLVALGLVTGAMPATAAPEFDLLNCTIVGTEGPDTLTGTDGDESSAGSAAGTPSTAAPATTSSGVAPAWTPSMSTIHRSPVARTSSMAVAAMTTSRGTPVPCGSTAGRATTRSTRSTRARPMRPLPPLRRSIAASTWYVAKEGLPLPSSARRDTGGRSAPVRHGAPMTRPRGPRGTSHTDRSVSSVHRSARPHSPKGYLG